MSLSTVNPSLDLLSLYGGKAKLLYEGVEEARARGHCTREGDEYVVTISNALWALTEDASRVHGGGRWLPRDRGVYWPQIYRDAEEIWEASRFEQASGDVYIPRVPPTSREITRADVIHELWKDFALRKTGIRPRLLRACWASACGMKSGAISRDSRMSITRQQLHSAKRRGLNDIAVAIGAVDKGDKT